MLDFINSQDGLLQGFWYVALFSSIIFAVQTVLTFIGSTDMGGINADFDGNLDDVSAPFQLFSFRNLINFMLGFGWTGVTFYNSIESKFLLVALACLVGILFIIIFFILIREILKLSEDNTFRIESLVGGTGRVYSPIPGRLTGAGKIQISVNGTMHEIGAATEDFHQISSGTMVKVDRIKNNLLIVSKLN